jgi:oligopeptide transport system ATP-binding protein
MNQEKPLLRVENMTKHFPILRAVIIQKEVGAVQAVEDVSFDIYKIRERPWVW